MAFLLNVSASLLGVYDDLHVKSSSLCDNILSLHQTFKMARLPASKRHIVGTRHDAEVDLGDFPPFHPPGVGRGRGIYLRNTLSPNPGHIGANGPPSTSGFRVAREQGTRIMTTICHSKVFLNLDYGALELFVRSTGLNHLIEKIMEYLSIEDIYNCMLLNTTWRSFLRNRRTIWIGAVGRKIMALRTRFPTIMEPHEVVADFNAIFPKRTHLTVEKKRRVLVMMREGNPRHSTDHLLYCLRTKTLHWINRLQAIKNPHVCFNVFLEELWDIGASVAATRPCDMEHTQPCCWDYCKNCGI